MSLHMYGVELSAVHVMLGSLEEVLLGQVIRIESEKHYDCILHLRTVGFSSGGYRSIGRFYNRDRTVSVRSSPFLRWPEPWQGYG